VNVCEIFHKRCATASLFLFFPEAPQKISRGGEIILAPAEKFCHLAFTKPVQDCHNHVTSADISVQIEKENYE